MDLAMKDGEGFGSVGVYKRAGVKFGVRARIGGWLRDAADRIDHEGAVVLSGLSVTCDRRNGWRVWGEMGVHQSRMKQPGMRLLYDPRTYDQAWSLAEKVEVAE